MKTYEEWVKLFKECRRMFENGTNYVQLILGEFKDDCRYGHLKVCCWDLETSKKINEFCEKNDLSMDFSGNYEIKIEDNSQFD